MFRIVPLSIIRSFHCTHNNGIYHTGLLTACEQEQDGSCSQAVSKPVWHIPLLCVQWKTPDNGQRNYPKHAEFHSKNKFEKLVYLVGFIIRICHDARSRCTVTMHGHLNVKLKNLKYLTSCILINLFYFTKPNNWTHNIHNNTAFYHSNMFRHNCAILRVFLHHFLKLYHFRIFLYM